MLHLLTAQTLITIIHLCKCNDIKGTMCCGVRATKYAIKTMRALVERWTMRKWKWCRRFARHMSSRRCTCDLYLKFVYIILRSSHRLRSYLTSQQPSPLSTLKLNNTFIITRKFFPITINYYNITHIFLLNYLSMFIRIIM